jgi:uncharacterized alkaline shock family protein YloU
MTDTIPTQPGADAVADSEHHDAEQHDFEPYSEHQDAAPQDAEHQDAEHQDAEHQDAQQSDADHEQTGQLYIGNQGGEPQAVTPEVGPPHGYGERANEVLHDAAGRAGAALSEAADKAGDALRESTERAMTRMRNNATLAAGRGTTTIANEVVEKIAGIAAREVPGVYDLGGDTVRVLSALREKLRMGEESSAQGVSVKLEGKDADLHIVLVIEYGFVVSTVCDKVREKTITAVENLLGLDVTNVDILVDDIHVEAEGPVGNDAERAAGYSTDTTGITVG